MELSLGAVFSIWLGLIPKDCKAIVFCFAEAILRELARTKPSSSLLVLHILIYCWNNNSNCRKANIVNLLV